MEIRDIKVYRGRNIYSHNRVIKLTVDLGVYADIPTINIPGFNQKLLQYLPGLKNHRCSMERPDGFIQRLSEGTYLAHVIEHCAIEILNALGHDINFGQARDIDGTAYAIVYGFRDQISGVEAGKLAVRLVDALIVNRELDLNGELDVIASKSIESNLGPSTKAIAKAALDREIPVTQVGNSSILQLGYGKYSKRIEATITDNTSCVAVDIACDKLLTKELLGNVGIPVPEGGICTNLDEAMAIVQRLGKAVVLKPQRGNQGKGVSTDLRASRDIEKAFEYAKEFDDSVIVEEFIEGRDYRVLVIDNKVIAVAQRIPAHVVGNGQNSIEELIYIENSTPNRGKCHEKPLTKIEIDDVTIDILQKQGYDLKSIPKGNEKVLLKPGSNLSTGGIAIDCTDKIHPQNRELAIRAASTIGLDIAGIDITCKDISIPIAKGTGGVIEVNAAPGLRMHLYPSRGKSRDVGRDIVDMLYPKGVPHSIPIISVTGTNGKTTTVRMISHIFKVYGHSVGMTTTEGIYIDDKLLMGGDTTGPLSAQMLLSNRDIDIAVLETARGGIIRSGLGYDLTDVGILTNISKDHLGLDGIYTLEDLLHVKSLVVEAIKDSGYAILNADDPIVIRAVPNIRANIIYFSTHANNIFVHRHLAKGGTSVFVKDGTITIGVGEQVKQGVYIPQVPATFGGKLTHNVENTLAAVSAAYALKVPIATIRKAMYSFYSDEIQNPGRFNIFSIRDFRIIIDYGHNIAGYLTVLETVKKMGATRLIGIIGVPGDRDDGAIAEIGKISGEVFDRLIIKEDTDLRGRHKGEVAKLLKLGALSSGIANDQISIIYDEEDALKFAISRAMAGDLIVIFYEKLKPILNIIKNSENLSDKFNYKSTGFESDNILTPIE